VLRKELKIKSGGMETAAPRYEGYSEQPGQMPVKDLMLSALNK